MFLDFYKLQEQPFNETPDTHYLHLSATHREALASLSYGIQAGRGFLALIAEPGMGKTTLLFHLLERLKNSVRTAFLFQTQCNSRELLCNLLTDLGVSTSGGNLAEMHEQLKQVLIGEARVGRRLVVFIDEAQNLEDSAMETLRLLSNFETQQSKLMQIVFAGQPQLAEKLARPNLAQLRQRFSILSHLRRFTPAETSTYIAHRLRVAGYQGNQMFTPGALQEIAAWTKGVPRSINILCFNALGLGFALDRKEIDRSVVQEVIGDLELNPLLKDYAQEASQHEIAPAVRASLPAPRIRWPEAVGPRRAFAIAALLGFLFVTAGAMTLHGNVSTIGNASVRNARSAVNWLKSVLSLSEADPNRIFRDRTDQGISVPTSDPVALKVNPRSKGITASYDPMSIAPEATLQELPEKSAETNFSVPQP